MKASRRGLCAVLVFSLALLLQGCSGRAPETAEPRETVTLSALQYELENIAVDFNALSYYDRIAEQTGVRVDFEDVKDSEWTSGVSLTFARGDLPDMILRGSLDIEEYGVSRHLLLPLEGYMEQGLLPNYTKRLEESGLRNQLTASDGHIYQLGFLISQNVNTDGHFFINQSWLDRLGLPVPTTVEELTEVLRRFRSDDPNSNGLQDEIPMEFTLDDNNTGIYNLFSFFGLPLNEEFVHISRTGRVLFAPMEESFLTALTWLHQMAEEKLLDVDFISQGSNIWAAKVNQGNVGLFSYWRLQNTALSPDLISRYRLFLPVSAEGAKACLPRNMDIIEFGAALTVNCRDVEAALRWLDAQFETENMLISQNGAVGDTLIRRADGRYVVAYVPRDNALYRSVPVICGQFFAPADYYASVYVPAAHRQEKSDFCEVYEQSGLLEPVSFKLMTAVAPKSAEEDARLTRLKASLKSVIDEAIVSMVTRGVTEESAAKLRRDLEDAGWEEYRQIYQDIYDRWQKGD